MLAQAPSCCGVISGIKRSMESATAMSEDDTEWIMIGMQAAKWTLDSDSDGETDVADPKQNVLTNVDVMETLKKMEPATVHAWVASLLRCKEFDNLKLRQHFLAFHKFREPPLQPEDVEHNNLLQQESLKDADKAMIMAYHSMSQAERIYGGTFPTFPKACAHLYESTEPLALGAADALSIVGAVSRTYAPEKGALKKALMTAERWIRDVVMFRIRGTCNITDRIGFLKMAERAYRHTLSKNEREKLCLSYHKNFGPYGSNRHKEFFFKSNNVQTRQQRKGENAAPRQRRVQKAANNGSAVSDDLSDGADVSPYCAAASQSDSNQ